jgi:hypothetical protein
MFSFSHPTSGNKEEKRNASKIVISLIVFMFVLQTVHDVCIWYILWLAFIKNGGSPDQALTVLEGVPVSNTIIAIISFGDLHTTLRLAIADGIMVHLLSLAFQCSYLSQVWRCWVICDRSCKAAAVPLVLTFSSFGTSSPLTGYC